MGERLGPPSPEAYAACRTSIRNEINAAAQRIKAHIGSIVEPVKTALPPSLMLRELPTSWFFTDRIEYNPQLNTLQIVRLSCVDYEAAPESVTELSRRDLEDREWLRYGYQVVNVIEGALKKQPPMAGRAEADSLFC